MAFRIPPVLGLATFDIARRTVRQSGVTRFIAVCLLSGYVWLGVERRGDRDGCGDAGTTLGRRVTPRVTRNTRLTKNERHLLLHDDVHDARTSNAPAAVLKADTTTAYERRLRSFGTSVRLEWAVERPARRLF
jgi:hypothetical protein